MTNSAPDVERIWAVMLDDPAPPLPKALDALAVARWTARRRTALGVAGSGLASALVIATVAAGVAIGGGATVAPAPPAPAAEPPAAAQRQQPPPLPVAPGRDAAHAHGTQNGAILMAAVPAGYTGVLQQSGVDSPAATWQLTDATQYVSTVYVVLTTGQADGMLSVDISGGLTGLGDDLCAQAVTGHLSVSSPGCDIVTVDGVPIRVLSTHEEDRGEVSTAVRLLDGGLLVVRAEQGIPPYHADGDVPPDGRARPQDGTHTILGGWPALPAVPLTTAQVAAIAANPALLP